MKRRLALAVLALTAVSCSVWARQNGISLVLDGTVVSTEVQTFQGRVYVPLSDVAKILDRRVVKKTGGYHLTQDGSPGKLGVDLFSGPWRLKVVQLQRVLSYNPLYGLDKHPIIPKETGDILIIVTCCLKNGTLAMQDISFDKRDSGNTALMDDQERGYVPLAYDTRTSGYLSAKLPPNATHDFVMIFSVPSDANLAGLTCTVRAREMDKNIDFQVSLKP